MSENSVNDERVVATSPIPESVTEDIPPEEDTQNESNEDPDAKKRVEDPEKKHGRFMEKMRQRFSMNLVWICITMIIVLFLLDGWLGFESKTIDPSSVMDFLKLIATTALGFALGKNVNGNGSKHPS